MGRTKGWRVPLRRQIYLVTHPHSTWAALPLNWFLSRIPINFAQICLFKLCRISQDLWTHIQHHHHHHHCHWKEQWIYFSASPPQDLGFPLWSTFQFIMKIHTLCTCCLGSSAQLIPRQDSLYPGSGYWLHSVCALCRESSVSLRIISGGGVFFSSGIGLRSFRCFRVVVDCVEVISGRDSRIA